MQGHIHRTIRPEQRLGCPRESLQKNDGTSGGKVTARLERLFRQPQQPWKWKMMMPDRPMGIQAMRICLGTTDRLLGTQYPY